MNILITVAVSLVATFGAIFGIYNYAPFDILSLEESPLLGTTVTTINGSDTLSSSRTTINDNFTALNNGKIENSTTSVASITTLPNLTTAGSLVTVGALTSGSLASGFTAVTVPLGGTGSTTLSSNQVILGNGTGNIKTVTGYGTSGQVLTSGGAGAAPTWTSSAVDQTASYNWTGTNFLVKNLSASSTVANPITLNGLSYSFGGTRQASSTVLMENGSGSLSWNPIYPIVLRDYTQASVTMTTAGTWYQVRQNIGVGTFTALANDSFRVRTDLAVDSSSGQEKMVIELGNGTASTTLLSVTQNSVYDDENCTFDIFLRGATNSWVYSVFCGFGAAVTQSSGGTSVVDLANGFNISASSTNSAQNGLTGISEYLRVERIR